MIKYDNTTCKDVKAPWHILVNLVLLFLKKYFLVVYFKFQKNVLGYYICNYGPAGNYLNSPIMLTGKACSKCPPDTTCQNGLCSYSSLPATPDPPVTTKPTTSSKPTTATPESTTEATTTTFLPFPFPTTTTTSTTTTTTATTTTTTTALSGEGSCDIAAVIRYLQTCSGVLQSVEDTKYVNSYLYVMKLIIIKYVLQSYN